MQKLKARLAAGLMSAMLFLAGLFAVPAFAAEGSANSVEIPVTVTTSGQGIPGETYTIKMVPQGNAPAPTSDTVTLTGEDLKAGTYTGQFELSFADVPVDVYSYTVYQVAPENTTGRGSYDTAVYTLTVTYEHPDGDMSKTAVIAAIHKDGDAKDVKYAACAFTNTYADLPAGTTDPAVTKHISGDTPKDSTDFTFVLEAVDGAPLPATAKDGKAEVVVNGEGTAEFGEIQYTAAGVYTYRCYEVNGGAEGYTYDSTVYTVRVVVTEGTKGFDVQRTITDQDERHVTDLTFTNAYEAPAQPTPKASQANPDTSDTNALGTTSVLGALGIAFVGIAVAMQFGRKHSQK